MTVPPVLAMINMDRSQLCRRRQFGRLANPTYQQLKAAIPTMVPDQAPMKSDAAAGPLERC